MGADQEATRSDEDAYSIISGLAEAATIEDETPVAPEERARLVQDLYEGPRQCQCCINWSDQVPHDIDLNAGEGEPEDARPLILRRRVLPGQEGGGSRLSVHSIEVVNPEVRAVLLDVFKGLDGAVPEVKYLILMAPFRQFFWRWEAFEKAIEQQEEGLVKSVLQQLRAIVKKELAEAFAVHKELTSHGVITFKYLWTIFPPGELIYSDREDADRFYILQSSRSLFPGGGVQQLELSCYYVDWNGDEFGYCRYIIPNYYFKGSKKIEELSAFPAKYLTNLDAVRQKCLERGRKFQALAGVYYKSYRHQGRESRRQSPGETTDKASSHRRIMIDADGHPNTPILESVLMEPEKLQHSTGLIRQAPINTVPPSGHVPLPQPVQGQMAPAPPGWNRNIQYNEDGYENYNYYMPPPPPVRRPPGGPMPPRGPMPPGPPRPGAMGMPPPPPRPPMVTNRLRRVRSVDSVSSAASCSDSDDEEEVELTDLQLQLCNSRVMGFCLKEKEWRSFDVNKVSDVEWNTAPFESLVLPEGYKELILSFVESQLHDGEAFDDVINGKGGGLVILLAGDPGVGKTLTAESVAEKIHAPLYKMELGHMITADNAEGEPRTARSEDEIVTAFELAAQWRAVLLIDECDLYLERRSDEASAQRNRLVSRFLQELEYYPSLLFLTTNRERVLDPAIYSRIHLTINYPALDLASRRAIWRTFLDREPGSVVSDSELDALAVVDLNGRRIRNISKTARIMAKREGRGIRFNDVKHVLRITEGVIV